MVSPLRPARIARLVTLCAVSAALASATPALAKPAKPAKPVGGLSPEEVAKLRSVRAAKISPDGRFVAWVKSVPRRPGSKKDGPAWKQLWVLTRDGKQRAFVGGHVAVGRVQWRPDGQAISYVAKRAGDRKPALYVIPVDGGESVRVLQHGGGVGAYAWLPDSRHVVFTARPPVPGKVRKLRDRGFKQEIVEEQQRPMRAYVVRVADPSAPEGHQGHGKPREIVTGGSASHPRVSPDGKRVALGVAPDPGVDSYYMRRQIHIFDLASGKRVGVVKRPGKLGDFAWSPDSKHLAMIGAADLNDPSAGRLLLCEAAGRVVRELLPNYPGHVTALAWRSADHVAYVGAKGVFTEVGEVSLAGTQVTRVAPGGAILRGLSVSRDGKSGVALAASPSHPYEVALVNLAKGQVTRLTDVNPWLKGRRLAKQEAVTWKARDGKTIGGVLVHPLDKPKGRAPLILAVHGGPESHVPNGWVTWYSGPGQMAAARGYYVLYPNYRGSTGRGVAFSKLDQADYAGAEFNDLIDGITHLDKAGLIDPKKVGITGGSYGGFASAWGATKLTKHFAASVMFVGISEQISKFGTTDIPYEMYSVHARKWPWKDWDFFRDRSPVTWVEQARTPILILHGKNDPRVHPSQSMTLFRYLKTIGKTPVRLVLYPGEGHGNTRASARYDYSLRMLRWMDHYLKGPGGKAPAWELDYSKVAPRRRGKGDAKGPGGKSRRRKSRRGRRRR